MALDRRVTLRCLNDDLTQDWDDVGQQRRVQELADAVGQLMRGDARDAEVARVIRGLPRLNVLGHPLIRSFDGAFQDDVDTSRRESITGPRNPHFWKVKTSRWRGAATDHSIVGPSAAWLCAGGLRAGGDIRDFYTANAAALENEAERFLPDDRDRELLRVDQKVTRFDAWKLQVICTVLLLFADASRTGERSGAARLLDPSGEHEIAELMVSTETITEDGDTLTEVELDIRLLDHSHAKAVQLVSEIARAAVNDTAETWVLLPVDDTRTTYRAIPTDAAMTRANTVLDTGSVDASEVADRLRLGVRAHYAPVKQLVDAQVAGLAVLALCGYWFVPTADHGSLPSCDTSSARHEQLP
jgi:hypothetical protein